jgi:hypothetical protein
MHEVKMNAAISLCEFVESHTCALAVGTCVTGALEAPLTRTLWAWVIVAMSTLLCVTNLRVRIFSSMALKDISATGGFRSFSLQSHAQPYTSSTN